MEFQNSYLTRKDFQGPEQTFYDMATHCQSRELAGPSMEPLNRGLWNTQDAAQVFIPLEHSSLASAQAAAQPRLLSAPSNGGLTMSYDMSEPPNLDAHDPDDWHWNGIGDENQSSFIEPIKNPLQTANPQSVRASSEASPTSHETPPQVLARIEEVSELALTVCFGTVSDIWIILPLWLEINNSFYRFATLVCGFLTILLRDLTLRQFPLRSKISGNWQLSNAIIITLSSVRRIQISVL